MGCTHKCTLTTLYEHTNTHTHTLKGGGNLVRCNLQRHCSTASDYQEAWHLRETPLCFTISALDHTKCLYKTNFSR